MAITFGTIAYKDKVTGVYISSIKKDQTGSSVDAMNEAGEVVQIDRYGKKLTIQVDGTGKDDISTLKIGAKLTIDGTEYIIDTVSTTQTNTGHYTLSLTASAPWQAGEEIANRNGLYRVLRFDSNAEGVAEVAAAVSPETH